MLAYNTTNAQQRRAGMPEICITETVDSVPLVDAMAIVGVGVEACVVDAVELVEDTAVLIPVVVELLEPAPDPTTPLLHV